jgi:hypothetical protein
MFIRARFNPKLCRRNSAAFSFQALHLLGLLHIVSKAKISTTLKEKGNSMALSTTCRFCERQTCNHDHDECAKAFGDKLNAACLKHVHEHPDQLLPVALQTELAGEKYKWYVEYLEREKRQDEIASQAESNKRAITAALKKIIVSGPIQKELRKLNRPLGHRNFQFNVEIKVNVTPEPVY